MSKSLVFIVLILETSSAYYLKSTINLFMEKIKLNSGAKLDITIADFATGLELFQALQRNIETRGIKLDKLDLGSDLSNIIASNADTIIKTITGVFTSDDVLNVIWKCGRRCQYNGAIVEPELFEDVKARKDFFPVVYHIGKENVSPFLPEAALKLFAQTQGENTSEKSNEMPQK